MEEKKKSVRSQLKELEIYVRAVCTNCGFEWNRHYSTQINRENRTITVTRER